MVEKQEDCGFRMANCGMKKQKTGEQGKMKIMNRTMGVWKQQGTGRIFIPQSEIETLVTSTEKYPCSA
jgi:hypothetical protein